MKAFIDIDDTLVLYKNRGSIHPYGVLDGKPFEPNTGLIRRLVEFGGSIVVWSGGGAAYARKVASMVLPLTLVFTAEDKASGFGKVKAGDIIVDDQAYYYYSLRSFGVHVLSPFEEWPE